MLIHSVSTSSLVENSQSFHSLLSLSSSFDCSATLAIPMVAYVLIMKPAVSAQTFICNLFPVVHRTCPVRWSGL